MNLEQMDQPVNLVQMYQGSLFPQLSELESELNSGGQITPFNRQDTASGGQNNGRKNVTAGRLCCYWRTVPRNVYCK